MGIRIITIYVAQIYIFNFFICYLLFIAFYSLRISNHQKQSNYF